MRKKFGKLAFSDSAQNVLETLEQETKILTPLLQLYFQKAMGPCRIRRRQRGIPSRPIAHLLSVFHESAAKHRPQRATPSAAILLQVALRLDGFIDIAVTPRTGKPDFAGLMKSKASRQPLQQSLR